MKKKEEDILEVVLRAFKLDQIELDYTLKCILDMYSTSKRFNLTNFTLGLSVGTSLMYIIENYII